MAGGATALAAAQILNFYLRGVTPTLPATVYLRLLTTPSTKTSSGTETIYGNWSRIALVPSLTLFTDPLLTSRSTNIDPIVAPTPTSVDDPLVAFDIVNTASGVFTATYLFGAIQPARSIVANKSLRFPSGALVVTA